MNSTTMMKSLGLCTLTMLAVGCSTTGTAVGDLEEPSTETATGAPEATTTESATLVWRSDGGKPTQGKIWGTLPDGTEYTGRYSEIVETVPEGQTAYLWTDWSPYWPDWEPLWNYDVSEGVDGWRTFLTIYTGRVVASLRSADQKTRMRCRFELTKPKDGLAGGGRGDCQLSNGEELEHIRLSSM